MVVTDTAGNVWISSDYGGPLTLTLGSTVLAPAPTGSGFLAKLSAAGDWQWAIPIPVGVGVVRPHRGLAPAGGAMILAASSRHPTRVGDRVLTADGGTAYVARVGADGAIEWLRQLGGSSELKIWDVAADASGQVRIAGHFVGALQLGGVSLTAVGGPGDSDIFVAAFGSRGQQRWVKAAGSAGQGAGDVWEGDVGTAVRLAPDGASYIAGEVVSHGTFDQLSLERGGFVWKIAP